MEKIKETVQSSAWSFLYTCVGLSVIGFLFSKVFSIEVVKNGEKIIDLSNGLLSLTIVAISTFVFVFLKGRDKNG